MSTAGKNKELQWQKSHLTPSCSEKSGQMIQSETERNLIWGLFIRDVSSSEETFLSLHIIWELRASKCNNIDTVQLERGHQGLLPFHRRGDITQNLTASQKKNQTL